MSVYGFTLIQRQWSMNCRHGPALKHEASGGRVSVLLQQRREQGVRLPLSPHSSGRFHRGCPYPGAFGTVRIGKVSGHEPFCGVAQGFPANLPQCIHLPDKTCYPVASANRGDFYNLMDVYLDAVFFLGSQSPSSSRKAGTWNRTRKAKGSSFKGVVYNEMKGAFSSPVLSRYCLHALFPDTVYALELGSQGRSRPCAMRIFLPFTGAITIRPMPGFFFWGRPGAGTAGPAGAALERFAGTAAPDVSASVIFPQAPSVRDAQADRALCRFRG